MLFSLFAITHPSSPFIFSRTGLPLVSLAPLNLRIKSLQKHHGRLNAHTILTYFRSVARLWARLLKVEEATIQASSDFFDLGGHSLLLAKLSAALLKDMGVVVSIPSIIERPTLGELADLLDEEMTRASTSTSQGKGLVGGGGGPASVILFTPALRYHGTNCFNASMALLCTGKGLW